MKSKCKCGDMFGFKVNEALQFIGMPEREKDLTQVRHTTSRGCVGRPTFPTSGQFLDASTFQGYNFLQEC